MTFWSGRRRGPLWVEIVLALAAGIAAFVLAAVLCAAARNHPCDDAVTLDRLDRPDRPRP